MVSASPIALHAQAADPHLVAEIRALKAQIAELRSAVGATRAETRRVSAKIKKYAAGGYEPPQPTYAVPAGATPLFVTGDKRITMGAITITPGGYLSADGIFRSRTTQGDMQTDWRAIPFGNSPLAHVNEYRFSSRSSRVALLAQAQVTPSFIASGYLEIDFLGAANTANSNESNSYNPRIRHLYSQIDANDYGLHALAGQTWSLAVMNSSGITPRNEVTPVVIDGQYVPGFVWARQPGIRLVKDFDKRLWLAVSAEASQTTFAAACPSGVNAPSTFGIAGTYGSGNSLTGITCTAAGTGGGFSGDTNNFSINHIPDIIAKAAYEADVSGHSVHLETFGIYRDFYDRTSFTNATGVGQDSSHDTSGFGVGGGLIAAVIPKRLDFQASALFGRGIGRYGTSQLADTTFNSDGSLHPTQEGMLLGGLVYHATPSIDLYAYSGIERLLRAYGLNSNGTYFGIGAPGGAVATPTACNSEPNQGGSTTTCPTGNGNTKQVWQITGGFWDKLYKGPFGEVRAGVQYSYTERQVFNIPGASYQPKANDHIVFTSLRYYPFQ
jgi:hypothetical protein